MATHELGNLDLNEIIDFLVFLVMIWCQELLKAQIPIPGYVDEIGLVIPLAMHPILLLH